MFRKKEPQEELIKPKLDDGIIKSFGKKELTEEYREIAIKNILTYPENKYSKEELMELAAIYLHQIMQDHRLIYGEI